MKENKQLTESLDQIVFRDRNKEYGAFYLRKTYSRNLLKAIVSAVFIYLGCIAIPVASNHFTKKLPRLHLFDTVVIIDKREVKEDDNHVREIKPKPQDELAQVIQRTNPNLQWEIINSPDSFLIDTAALNSQVENFPLDTGTHIGLTGIGNPDPEFTKKQDSVYLFVTERPEFIGGEAAFREFLLHNFHYPEHAVAYGIQGIVQLNFIVEKDGSITNIEPVTKIGAGCEEEAVRVVSHMPHWKPGAMNGNPVRVKMNLPIQFKMQN
jgi:periplasmic protein TonB